MLVFTMILALFPGIGDLLFVKVAFRAPKVTSSRKGTAHRQNLYTQTPDSPHACGRLVIYSGIFEHLFLRRFCEKLYNLPRSKVCIVDTQLMVPSKKQKKGSTPCVFGIACSIYRGFAFKSAAEYINDVDKVVHFF